jgi:hypothetical protein
MAHTFTFTVTVELARESGKFAGRDEMADAIRDALEGADPGSVDGIGADGESSYTVESWDVGDA